MRQRMIKPEFFTDDRITECSVSARLLFIATWVIADDFGNLEFSPKQIKRQAFPDDLDVNVAELLNELIAHGLLIEYSQDDCKYLHVKGFQKHQTINRPSKPRCPEFDYSLAIHTTLTESSLSTHPEEKGKEKKRSRRGTPTLLTADWRPDEESLASAKAIGIDTEFELLKFRKYWTDRNEKKQSWNSTWLNWISKLKNNSPKPTTYEAPKYYDAHKQHG